MSPETAASHYVVCPRRPQPPAWSSVFGGSGLPFVYCECHRRPQSPVSLCVIGDRSLLDHVSLETTVSRSVQCHWRPQSPTSSFVTGDRSLSYCRAPLETAVSRVVERHRRPQSPSIAECYQRPQSPVFSYAQVTMAQCLGHLGAFRDCSLVYSGWLDDRTVPMACSVIWLSVEGTGLAATSVVRDRSLPFFHSQVKGWTWPHSA